MSNPAAKLLDPLKLLKDSLGSRPRDSGGNTGLIILNTPITNPDLLQRLWTKASYIVCADGGANQLYDLLNRLDDNLLEALKPDEIHGDLDSIRDSVRQHYTSENVPITKDDDQYHTDFEKSIGRIAASLPAVIDILVLGSLSGRVDQGIGLLSEMYRQQKRHPEITLWFLSEDNISFVLDRGHTTIATDVSTGLITENAGILPLFGPASITIEGFEWDVSDWHTELGDQVSTSNHIKASQVAISTNHPVLFTIELGNLAK
ncbi:thiamine pyrophosphokinase [Sphaceloma murrayae]|uniref:Thiamine pyrophosphokinase n=1 Tax=Sphaceloma murrayae TaxID=2082308 RepID=A0A2K1QP70_9PEZI|nr:thiamine pyrophosphokinase [Sphaceloma murrayae]